MGSKTRKNNPRKRQPQQSLQKRAAPETLPAKISDPLRINILEHNPKPIENPNKLANLTIIFSNVVIAIFTIVIALTSWYQWRSMEGQNKIISEQIKIMQNEERAWVGVKSYKLVTLEENQPLLCTVHYLNSGHTPAIDCRTAVNIAVADDSPLTEDQMSAINQDLLNTVGSNFGSNFVFLPGTDQLSAPQLSITSKELHNIREGKSKIYLFGQISYKDCFARPHLTKFCAVYNSKYGVFDDYPVYNHVD